MGAKVRYGFKSSVVVGAIEDKSNNPNFIGEILSTILDRSGSVSKLQVSWFDTHSVKQRLSGR